jgi:hypothetical protein
MHIPSTSESTSETFRASPIVVAGMHRSGTSYLASVLAAGGVAMGTRLVEPDANNRRGYFEDCDFLALDRRLMLASTDDAPGHRDWGWTETEHWEEGPAAGVRAAARELLAARRREGRRWGWKDPRTTLLLDFWDGLAAEAGAAPGYLFVYRAPWDVADAIQRLGAEVFLRRPEYAYRIWRLYNRRLLEFRRRHPGRTLLVAIEAVLAAPHRFADLLAARLGCPLDGDLLTRLRGEEGLRARPLSDPLVDLVAATSPETCQLFGELQAAADLPRDGWTAPRPRPASALAAPPVQPLVSVVIPCRDLGELLVEAVASAVAAAPGSELILVDDGSRQARTLEVLARLRRAGFDVLDLPGVGLPAARNAGIARARGRYILTLDADDRLRPGFVEPALALLEAEPDVGVVYGDRLTFGLRSGVVEVPDFDLDRLLCGNFIAACALFRKAAWESCGGYDGELPAWEDWELWIALAERGWRFRHLPVLSFDHRLRPGSTVVRCEQGEVGAPLQERIVRKHEAIYLRRLPQLLMAMQARAGAEAEVSALRAANRGIDAEVERWRGRVRFMEATRAWRWRERLLRLRGHGAPKSAAAAVDLAAPEADPQET